METKKYPSASDSTFGKFKQFWHWLWNSNSILSWIVSFVLAFILVRFVFYPLIGLALQTSLPLVVIESNSMERHFDFEGWWKAHEDFYDGIGITKGEAEKWPFPNGINEGDIAIIRGKDFQDLKEGDVIVFQPSPQNKAIIHRIVRLHENYVETKGDANIGQIEFEKNVRSEQIRGVAIARIPYLGWIKLFFVRAFS